MIRPRTHGFTIVEIVVVVVVVAILASLGIFAYTLVQNNVRNDQRSADITLLADALERYYRDNGVYPSCNTMTQSAATVANLLKVDKEVLRTPTATIDTNSIQCGLLSSGSGADVYGYVGDTTSACTSGSFCYEFTLQYRQEGSGAIISKESIRCGQSNSVGCYRPAN